MRGEEEHTSVVWRLAGLQDNQGPDGLWAIKRAALGRRPRSTAPQRTAGCRGKCLVWSEDRPALAPAALLGPKWLTILHPQTWQCRTPPGAGRRSPRQEGGWRCHSACSPLASPAGCLMGRQRVRPGCRVLRRLIRAGEADEPGRGWGEEFCSTPASSPSLREVLSALCSRFHAVCKGRMATC